LKKTKVYRPRRGMRFTNGRRGVTPSAGFIGGDPIGRTRPFAPPSNPTGLGSTARDGRTARVTLNWSLVSLTGTTTIEYVTTGVIGNAYDFNIFPDGTGSVLQVSSTATLWHFVPDVTTIGQFVSLFPSTFVRILENTADESQVVPNIGVNTLDLAGGTNSIAESVESQQLFRIAPKNDSSVQSRGSVMCSLKGVNPPYEPFSPAISSSSLVLHGAISTGRLYERKKLNASLISSPVNSLGGLLPGVPPWPSVTVIDSDPSLGSPTGNIGRVPPSWTQVHMGESRAFVIQSLSSSNYENVAFNTFTSGVEGVEFPSVSNPTASSAIVKNVLHYTKEQRYQTIVVKKSASFFDTVATQFNSSSADTFGQMCPPKQFVAGLGTLVSEVNFPGALPDGTGSAPNRPAVITLDVPVKGRLVDIKVWIELNHQSSSLVAMEVPMPLGSIGVAIRSPNLRWNGWGVPIDNDRFLNGFTKDPVEANTPVPTQFEFFRNTFILWQGSSLLGDATPWGHVSTWISGSSKVRQNLVSWDRDLGMRTVFSDGAPVLNPRMNYSSNLSGNFIGSPNAALGINSSWGMSTTWTGSSGSPPAGWLTGPANTAAVNEWPTTGTSNGTNQIRPIYSLLDPIFQSVPVIPGVTFPTFVGSPVQGLVDYTKFQGSRPGLRGTEISGTWQILFSTAAYFFSRVMPLWFRQARLEITYETGISGRQMSLQGFQSLRAGDVQLYSVSESLGFSVGGGTSSLNVNMTVPEQCSIGRSFGIALKSGSIDSRTALVYRLTGSLADIVGSTPSWLLTGRNGMPNIPESSASLVPVVPLPVSAARLSDFLQPRRDLDQSQRLIDVASDANPQTSLRDLAAAFVSSSAI